MPDQTPGDDRPDFGPSGYLPERASKRARKIVLRAPLGMQWIWGAVVVGIGVLVVGVIFLATRGGPPGPPFVELGVATELEDGVFDRTDDADEYLATTSGRLRIFHVPDEFAPIEWCETSRQFEGPNGTWTATGRGRGGAPSLAEHPTVIVEGIAYWDPSATIPGPTPDPLEVDRACS